jgi:hypothetical protein
MHYRKRVPQNLPHLFAHLSTFGQDFTALSKSFCPLSSVHIRT